MRVLPQLVLIEDGITECRDELDVARVQAQRIAAQEPISSWKMRMLLWPSKTFSSWSLLACAPIASYEWPGNVRELKTVLSVAQLRLDGDPWLDLEHLPAELTAAPASTGELEQVEATALRRALAEANGNLSAAARKLGIARSTLYRMLRKHS